MKYITLLLALVLFLCNNLKTIYEHKKIVLAAKTKALRNNTTIYQFAYTDGTSDDVSFGLYTTVAEKGTVYMMREKDFFGMWNIVTKELYYKR